METAQEPSLWSRSTLLLLLPLVALLFAPRAARSQELTVPRHALEPVASFPEPFSLIRGVRELPDGRVLVSDWIEQRVAALNFDDGSVRDLGRVGSGPGEFRLPARLLALAGDSTLLVDTGNARLIVITPSLRFARAVSASPGTPYAIEPRGADSRGRLYFAVPRWAAGPNALDTDSVVVARWDPATDVVEPVAKILGYRRSEASERGRRTPGLPMVAFAPQDAWAVAADGHVAIVRSVDYHVEWLTLGGASTRGPAVPYRRGPVTEADKTAFVRAFLARSPMSGRGEDGGIGHTPSEFQSPQAVAEMVRTNEFAAVLPPFEPGGAWVGPGGTLWVERSTPAADAPELDVFDRQGRRTAQVALPAGREVVGFGTRTLYAVVADDVGLQTLERYAIP